MKNLKKIIGKNLNELMIKLINFPDWFCDKIDNGVDKFDDWLDRFERKIYSHFPDD